MISNSKFIIYTKSHKALKLSDFKNLQKGDKLHLAVFSFGDSKWTKFIYIFDHIEESLAKFKRHIKKWIFGYIKIINFDIIVDKNRRFL